MFVIDDTDYYGVSVEYESALRITVRALDGRGVRLVFKARRCGEVPGTIYAPQITETGISPAREMARGEEFTVRVFRLYRFIVLTDGNQ